jgi:hypothetical protein
MAGVLSLRDFTALRFLKLRISAETFNNVHDILSDVEFKQLDKLILPWRICKSSPLEPALADHWTRLAELLETDGFKKTSLTLLLRSSTARPSGDYEPSAVMNHLKVKYFSKLCDKGRFDVTFEQMPN